MENFYAPPTSGDLETNGFEYFPTVEFSAMKTPQLSVSLVDKEYVTRARAACKAGFSFYDKETTQRTPISSFSFIVLKVYSSLSGYVEGGSGQESVSYYSNSVENSAEEPFVLFMKGNKRPIATGYYSGKRTDTDNAKLTTVPKSKDPDAHFDPARSVVIPQGVSFHQEFIVFWIEEKRIMKLKVTTMLSREIKVAISDSYKKTGSNVSPAKINLFALANKSLWGFKVTSFSRKTKDGEPYNGKGDMYLLPVFECGVIPETAPLYNEMRAHQKELDNNYQAQKAKRQRFEQMPIENAQTTLPMSGNASFPGVDNQPQRATRQDPEIWGAPETNNGDVLPF